MGYGPSSPKRSTERRNPLGTVWVLCPYPILAHGLRELLKAQARVHVGHDPPKDAAPSSIIFCPNRNEAEEVASGVRRLREMYRQAPILVFGLPTDQRVARACLRSGASGYLRAGMRPDQIVEALSLASAGEVVIPREVLEGLVEEEAPEEGASALTPRQREILSLVAEGLSNAEIARRLHLSEYTVKQHLRQAYKALKVKNRTEAARLWSGPDS